MNRKTMAHKVFDMLKRDNNFRLADAIFHATHISLDKPSILDMPRTSFNVYKVFVYADKSELRIGVTVGGGHETVHVYWCYYSRYGVYTEKSISRGCMW